MRLPLLFGSLTICMASLTAPAATPAKAPKPATPILHPKAAALPG